jgi:hypothetical protein
MHPQPQLRPQQQWAKNQAQDHWGSQPQRASQFNTKRGLIKHETEIKQLPNKEKISIMFLVETDTKMIRTSEEYKLEGFITILKKKDEQDENLRIIALIEEELSKNVKIR